MKHSLSSKEILQILKQTKPLHAPGFLINFVPAETFKLGFCVSASCGGAVQRNRFKRKVRIILKNKFLRNQPFHLVLKTTRPIIKISNIKNLLEEMSNNILNWKSGAPYA